MAAEVPSAAVARPSSPIASWHVAEARTSGTATKTHTYAAAGTYTVRVHGLRQHREDRDAEITNRHRWSAAAVEHLHRRRSGTFNGFNNT